MTQLSKIAGGIVIATAVLASAPASAVLVTFGGQNTNVLGGDQSGLTSTHVPVSNIANPATGYFVETFDFATRNPALSGLFPPATGLNPGSGIQITQNQGCSINSFGAVSFTTTGGGLGVQKGSTGSGATPANDSTCFAFGPRPGGTLPATVKVDYTSFLNNVAPGKKITYIGMYYGSIDTYNNIAFYNGNTLLTGTGIMSDGVITGQEILSSQGGATGNQFQPGSNVYVNLDFSPNESFTAFEFRTTGVAFELDNIVIGVSSVPEPASLALVGLGLVGFALRRRKAGAKQ